MQATCSSKHFGLRTTTGNFMQAVYPRVRFDPAEVRLARGLAMQVFLTGLAVSGLMVLGVRAFGL